LSNQALNEIWSLRGITPATKIVLIRLADRANGKRYCFPSIKNIAIECGVNERTVQRAIIFAEKSGFIRTERQSGKPTIYHINPRQIVTPDKLSPPTLATQTPDIHDIDTYIEPKITQNTIPVVSSFEASVTFEEFWQAYPKKSFKGFALKSYRSALGRIKHPDMMAALKAYKFPPEEKFCPKPQDWLDGDCWLDKKSVTTGETPLQIWELRMEAWRKTGEWNGMWGADPRSNNCICPSEILNQTREKAYG